VIPTHFEAGQREEAPGRSPQSALAEPNEMRLFAHRQRLRRFMSNEVFISLPVVARMNTRSDLSPCQAYLRERGEVVERGIRNGRSHAVPVAGLVAWQGVRQTDDDGLSKHRREEGDEATALEISVKQQLTEREIR
jgi:hypothetical protein